MRINLGSQYIGNRRVSTNVVCVHHACLSDVYHPAEPETYHAYEQCGFLERSYRSLSHVLTVTARVEYR